MAKPAQDLRTRAREAPATVAPRFDRRAAFRSVGFSLIFNALFPYLLFRYLEPRFPPESILPLLYVTIFPVLGFFIGLVRKRSVDAIALIALAGITIHLVITILSPNVGTALVLRSFQGAIIGGVFLLSALIGRPVLFYVGRQFALAGAPKRRERFEKVVEMDKGRTFLIATVVWGLGLIIMSGIHVWLAMTMPHAEFILVSPILGAVADIVLILWSIQYMTTRLFRYLRALG